MTSPPTVPLDDAPVRAEKAAEVTADILLLAVPDVVPRGAAEFVFKHKEMPLPKMRPPDCSLWLLPIASPMETLEVAQKTPVRADPPAQKKTAEVIAEVLFDARPKTNEGAGVVIKLKNMNFVRATFSAPTPPAATPAAASPPEATECAPPASPHAAPEDAAPESPPPTPKRVVLNIPQLPKPSWALPADSRSTDYIFQLPDILLTAIRGIEQDAEPNEETRVESPAAVPISADEPTASALTPADSPTVPTAPTNTASTDAPTAEEPRPPSPKPKVVKLTLPPAKKTTVRPVLAPPRPKAPERTDAANMLDAVLAAIAGLGQQPAAPVPTPVPPSARVSSLAPPAASVAASLQPPPVMPPRKPLGLRDPRPNAERYRAEAAAMLAAQQASFEQNRTKVSAPTLPTEPSVEAAERTTAQVAVYEDAFQKMVDYYTTWGFSRYPNPFLAAENQNQSLVFRDVFRVPDPTTGELVSMVAVEFGGRRCLHAAKWSDVLDSGNSLPFWEFLSRLPAAQAGAW
ncbi:hypothetical protein M3Y99_01448800 [Aphelenchoides fujianensis]|nr:hypothetical protein M3Y99_01448800 [Aphelenchoides fujianensis]